jgi:hypothetical protein
MQLDSGDYTIHAGPNGRIQVSFAGNIRNAAAKCGNQWHACESGNQRYVGFPAT